MLSPSISLSDSPHSHQQKSVTRTLGVARLNVDEAATFFIPCRHDVFQNVSSLTEKCPSSPWKSVELGLCQIEVLDAFWDCVDNSLHRDKCLN